MSAAKVHSDPTSANCVRLSNPQTSWHGAPSWDRPPTAFEQRVYTAITEVPAGKVTTYRELARYLGCGSAQAIGQALKRNPYAPEVPCHRVVKADLTLGGYHGETKEGPTLQRKRQRLLDEGVEFTPNGKITAEHCYTFPNAETQA